MISDYLYDFSAVSVREKQDVPKIESVIRKKVSSVLDPVFLSNENDFQRLIYGIRIDEEPYVLVYALSYDNRITEIVKRRFSEKKIIDISPITINLDWSSTRIEYKRTIGPDEFLTLIKYADCVLTNSFHGTAISIIFHKSFYVFPLQMRNERIQNIINITNLGRRFVNNPDNLDSSEIDYEKVDRFIDIARSESKRFLFESLIGVRI